MRASPTDLGSLTCLQAIRQKNWASFAYNYNGSEYGNYDQIMENNYNQIVAQEGD
jgi:hypothetical protein